VQSLKYFKYEYDGQRMPGTHAGIYAIALDFIFYESGWSDVLSVVLQCRFSFLLRKFILAHVTALHLLTILVPLRQNRCNLNNNHLFVFIIYNSIISSVVVDFITKYSIILI
jgi:hypothetical protein